MSYDYKTERTEVLSDEGQRKTFDVLATAKRLCALSGVVRADKLMAAYGSGSGWQMLATIDRLVEVGELYEIPTSGAAQHRMFGDKRCDRG